MMLLHSDPKTIFTVSEIKISVSSNNTIEYLNGKVK